MPQTAPSLNAAKRFYSGVSVAAKDGNFAVLLDGRNPRSPKGAPLALPAEALAQAVAAEWEAQGEHVEFVSMPATRLAHTALDAVAASRADMAAEVARWAGSDLVCYFAEGPTSLVARQEALWAPLLEWARVDLGLVFERAAGIVHREQPRATLAGVEALAAGLDDFALAGLAFGTALFGSAIIALALMKGRLTGEQAFEAARLDEAFQEERWGVDAETIERTEALAADAAMLEAWFKALR